MHITLSPLSLSINATSFYVARRPISLSSLSSTVSHSSFGAAVEFIVRGTEKRRERNRGGGFFFFFFLSLPHLTTFVESTATTMSAFTEQDPRIKGIKTKIRVVPNFPKPGIMFQDITTLLLDPKAFKDTIDLFVERYKGKNISVVAGIEARGFIFGPPIALAIGAKFVPLRKPKKLPGEVISEEYILEYGRDCLEMHVGAVKPGERALVVDDLIATGGTLCAAMNLLERVGAEVVECACLIELPDLKGRDRLKGKPLYVLVESH